MARRRNRYTDVASAGRSQAVPYIEGESAEVRHKRRLAANLEYEPTVREWCATHEIGLKITNNGHHWKFQLGRCTVEWWPSSAKMVFDKKWRRGLHVHDAQKALRELKKHFK